MIFQEALIQSLNQNRKRNAIEMGSTFITYGELQEKSDRITQFLLSKKLRPETFIGIMLTNRVDLICAIIGIANARCVFVPIDAGLPKARLQALQQILQLEHVITSDQENEENIFQANLYSFEEILRTDSGSIPVTYPSFDAQDSLYIYFTSGSTGIPKSILGKNCSLSQFLKWEIREFQIDATFRVSQFISPFFDAFLRDLFVPLLSGATLCIPPQEEGFFTPENLVNWIDSENITLIHCVPSLFRVFNDTDKLTKDHFQKLQYILLSGEKIIPAELVDWYKIFNESIQLVNLYGTTETTMIKAFYRIRPEDATKVRIPIGGPIDDTELLVTGKDFKACSPLVTGDLYIVSDFFTKGYLNNHELNQEKFVTIVQNGHSPLVAFKTGDKARKLIDGTIELLGREDRQVKLNGIRIELDEIENVLMQSGLVQTALVLIWERTNQDPNNEQKESTGISAIMVAFVVEKEGLAGTKTLVQDLQEYLEERLPNYMVPARIEQKKSFPMLQNGKVDISDLLKQLAESKTTIELPANELEEKLLDIWIKILGQQTITTEDSFHQLGGNSLKIMRLVAAIYDEFKVRISLNNIFNNLTIKKQANLIKVDLDKQAGLQQHAEDQSQFTF